VSVKVAHHHHNAAEQAAQAAFHHKQAQVHFEAGRESEGMHHAMLAQAHQHYANAWAAEASKAYLDVYGTSRRAAVA
jgi:hypothetical protein